MANNDDPDSGTSVGYTNDSITGDKYFFIDVPSPDFGDFIIEENGRVGIGTFTRFGVGSIPFQLTVLNSTGSAIAAESSSLDGSGIYALATGRIGTAVSGTASGDVGIGVRGQGKLSDFWAQNGTYGGPSSRRWKSNVENISDALDKLSKIRGVYFDWDEEHGGQHAIGFIAEDVGEVLPEVVFYEENGIDASGMDYSKMTPLLVEASNAMRREYQDKFEEQQSEIDILKQEMAELKMLLKSQVNTQSEE